jgi:hypothetical protein
MAYQKLQAHSALAVIPSDNYNIPSGHVLKSGTATTSSQGRLIDANNTFNEQLIGCIVYDVTGNQVSAVKGLFDENTLLLQQDIMLVNEDYKVFDRGRSDCVLYVGGAGDLRVITSGGDDVTFYGVEAGSFLPVSVLKVWATGTTATNILALW